MLCNDVFIHLWQRIPDVEYNCMAATYSIVVSSVPHPSGFQQVCRKWHTIQTFIFLIVCHSLTLPQCSCSNLGFLHGQKCIHVVPNASLAITFIVTALQRYLWSKWLSMKPYRCFSMATDFKWGICIFIQELLSLNHHFWSLPSLAAHLTFNMIKGDANLQDFFQTFFSHSFAAMCNVHVNRIVMWWTCDVLKLLLVNSISSFTCFSYCSLVRSTCMSLVLSSSVQGSGKLLPFPSTFALVWYTLPSAFLAASTWLITLMHRQPCVIKAGELSLDQGNTYVNRRLNTCIDD